MRKGLFLILTSFILLLFSHDVLSAEEKSPGPPSTGQISLPWDKFQKLLNLDEERISLDIDEFAAITRQTGARELPPFAVKEGKVVLKREDFKKLLKSMDPPKADPALGEFLLTSAYYHARVEKEATEVSATFNIEVLPRSGRKNFVLVPLLRKEVALKTLTLDGKDALLTEKNGYHSVAVAQEGSHKAMALFTIATDLKRGPQSISFPVPRTPIIRLNLEIPLPSIQPEISSATSIKRIEKKGRTIIEAVLSPTENVHVAWSRIIPEAEKGPPKIYADLWQLLSIEDDALRVHATASINVLQNTITGITLRVPDKYQILDVMGQVVGDWKEREVKGQKTLEVSLKKPRQGKFDFVIRAERIFEDGTVVADFNGFVVPNSIREKGFIAVEMKGSAEAKVTEAVGLDRASFSELPPQLVSYSVKPLIFAYKYLRHPYRMVLDISKHKELPVISTVVDSASGITLFTEDGKLVHRLTYTVRNTWKQFMEVTLPKDAELWGTYVGGKSVKPTKNENEKILIPLNRSKSSEGGLAPFDVELIYFQKAEKFRWFGIKKSSFAIPDLMMSRVIWSIYLPFDYSFVHFGGTMEKEKIARGISPLLGLGKRMVDYNELNKQYRFAPGAAVPEPGAKGKRDVDKKKKARSLLESQRTLQSEFGRNLPVDQEVIADQLSREMSFSAKLEEVAVSGGMTTGVMPIRVQVPTIGQVYRFAKQIVSDEPLVAEVTYIKDTPFTVIKLIILLLILYALYRRRNWLRKVWDSESDRYRKSVAKFITPLNLIIISALLFLFSSFFLHPFFAKLFFLILLVAATYYGVHYLRARKERKKKDIGTEIQK
ncbi:MAG: hypothetical protein JW896_11410 [Deltaproteobacteria bacterium]|nr:hypothetical protein [Deltaproteobacteria bacterium]